MRRDPLFYKIFQQSPDLLFALIRDRPANAANYRFDSVAVKEPKFEIDGVFLPPESDEPGIVYFCEVQFQKDEELYERLFSESALYFYRNTARFSDWQAVVIYPNRNTEQTKLHPHRSLLNGEQVHRIFLDEIGDIESLPLPVAALVLTITKETEAPQAAKTLLSRIEQTPLTPKQRDDIIDIVTSILVYKFANLSRAEVRAMIGLNLSEEPRAIREAKEEGRGEGREEEAVILLTRILSRHFQQEIPESVRSQLATLSLPILEDLSEALFDFTNLADLENWIAEHTN
ncbi:Rpn family recombination-promoting nuclease/putative transposase [Leptolyngbya sp. GGD]|uniref:Rpn family recombination-promoting nuclease/putative transposase n=1 Tax=Leptolyngbya sp. GGD TaxID=2997907 RepID=UPI00227A30AC|nr:Rpn family recombination-promoting nuclease/putative transposase [Leptolyngbya sp. GGD]MCY6492233.1 Rpn family recombination-promoting nuclease/putative transposase [Leptolyngbya sp. GGD]